MKFTFKIQPFQARTRYIRDLGRLLSGPTEEGTNAGKKMLRDSSYLSDAVAVNFEQIFATCSPDTVRRAL